MYTRSLELERSPRTFYQVRRAEALAAACPSSLASLIRRL